MKKTKIDKMKSLKAFIIGSSYPLVVWPFLYLGLSKRSNPESSFQFESAALVLPIIFGLLNIIVVSIRKNPRYQTWLYASIGLLYGLGLSLYGNFVTNLPTDLFLLPDTPMKFITIPWAMLAYGFIWAFIARPINQLFDLEPSNTKRK